MELIAQGVANFFSPLFGGLPATGAIARTATNIRSGAKTPVAGMIHALTLLLILLFAAPLAAHVPLAVLAGLLFVVAYNMGEWHEIPSLLKLTKADIAVWLATFALTVVADLTVAVEVGHGAGGAPLHPSRRRDHLGRARDRQLDRGRPRRTPAGHGDSRLRRRCSASTGRSCSARPTSCRSDRRSADDAAADRHRPLRHVPAMDASGLQALEDLADQMHASGRTLLLCGARDQPARLMEARRIPRAPRRANICANIQEALNRAEQIAGELGVGIAGDETARRSRIGEA